MIKWCHQLLCVCITEQTEGTNEQWRKMTLNICDLVWQNQSYCLEIHIFILWYIKLALKVLFKFCKFHWISYVVCIYDKLCVKILLSQKILLRFESLKLAQNLHGNKTGFVRPGHIYRIYMKVYNIMYICIPYKWIYWQVEYLVICLKNSVGSF